MQSIKSVANAPTAPLFEISNFTTKLSGLPDLPLAHAVGRAQNTGKYYCRTGAVLTSVYEQSHSHQEDCNASSSDINGDDNSIEGIPRLRFGRSAPEAIASRRLILLGAISAVSSCQFI